MSVEKFSFSQLLIVGTSSSQTFLSIPTASVTFSRSLGFLRCIAHLPRPKKKLSKQKKKKLCSLCSVFLALLWKPRRWPTSVCVVLFTLNFPCVLHKPQKKKIVTKWSNFNYCSIVFFASAEIITFSGRVHVNFLWIFPYLCLFPYSISHLTQLELLI